MQIRSMAKNVKSKTSHPALELRDKFRRTRAIARARTVDIDYSVRILLRTVTCFIMNRMYGNNELTEYCMFKVNMRNLSYPCPTCGTQHTRILRGTALTFRIPTLFLAKRVSSRRGRGCYTCDRTDVPS